MDLSDLGYDQWFVEKYNEMNILDCRPARVSQFIEIITK